MTTRILALCTSCCALTNAQIRSWYTCTATAVVVAVDWQLSHANYGALDTTVAVKAACGTLHRREGTPSEGSNEAHKDKPTALWPSAGLISMTSTPWAEVASDARPSARAGPTHAMNVAAAATEHSDTTLLLSVVAPLAGLGERRTRTRGHVWSWAPCTFRPALDAAGLQLWFDGLSI